VIRKLGRIKAAPETVRAMFRDVARWPEWLPSIVSTEIVESDAERCLALVHQVLHGRTSGQTIELRFTSQGYVERQIAGRLKHYEADWRFLPDREGGGTLVSAGIRLDLGVFGLFVARRTVQRTIDRTFEETLRGAHKQIRLLGTPAPGRPAEAPVPRETRIRVYETVAGLEIWVDDRRYVAPAAD
jgi:ribosome-associated toxin RatA of RatAB toxin-antitoxin module